MLRKNKKKKVNRAKVLSGDLVQLNKSLEVLGKTTNILSTNVCQGYHEHSVKGQFVLSVVYEEKVLR